MRNILGDLASRDRPFALNPLALDSVRIPEGHDLFYRRQGGVGHETEPSGFSSSLILQDGAVFNVAELDEVVSELLIREVVWKASNEYFSQLRVHKDLLLATVSRLLIRHPPTLSLVNLLSNLFRGGVLLVLRRGDGLAALAHQA